MKICDHLHQMNTCSIQNLAGLEGQLFLTGSIIMTTCFHNHGRIFILFYLITMFGIALR